LQGLLNKQGTGEQSESSLGKGLIVLILTRRVGEKLIIGENVTVCVLGVKGNQIRIGIDAPPEVAVNREEIHAKILKQKKALNGTKTLNGTQATSLLT
jgi:carbon storage regulator